MAVVVALDMLKAVGEPEGSMEYLAFATLSVMGSIGGSMEYLALPALGVMGSIGAYFALKPVLALRTTMEAIASALARFADVDVAVCSPGDARISKARGKYFDLAGLLIPQALSVPLYAVWSSLNIIPPFEDILSARANLIGLSNTVGVEGQREDNIRRQEHIETALRLTT
jgi:hypothetical protein